MSFCKFGLLLACIFVLPSCGSSQNAPLDAVGVCRLISEIDVSTIKNNEMADHKFDRFALELQDMNVKPEIKEVFNLLIGADAKDTYQLYIEAGNAYNKDWSCEPMKHLLSIK